MSTANAVRARPPPVTLRSSGAWVSAGRRERSLCSAVSAQNSTSASRAPSSTRVNEAPARNRPSPTSPAATWRRRAGSRTVVTDPSSRGTSRRIRTSCTPSSRPGNRGPTPRGGRATGPGGATVGGGPPAGAEPRQQRGAEGAADHRRGQAQGPAQLAEVAAHPERLPPPQQEEGERAGRGDVRQVAPGGGGGERTAADERQQEGPGRAAAVLDRQREAHQGDADGRGDAERDAEADQTHQPREAEAVPGVGVHRAQQLPEARQPHQGGRHPWQPHRPARLPQGRMRAVQPDAPRRRVAPAGHQVAPVLGEHPRAEHPRGAGEVHRQAEAGDREHQGDHEQGDAGDGLVDPHAEDVQAWVERMPLEPHESRGSGPQSTSSHPAQARPLEMTRR